MVPIFSAAPALVTVATDVARSIVSAVGTASVATIAALPLKVAATLASVPAIGLLSRTGDHRRGRKRA